MKSCEEYTQEFKKYLRKLLKVIMYEAFFSFGKSKIIDKNRIDDVLCCVEVSWPEDYKKYLTKVNSKRLKSPMHYNQMILAIKNKFLFSSSCYYVYYDKAVRAINMLIKSIDEDMCYIHSEDSGMF